MGSPARTPAKKTPARNRATRRQPETVSELPSNILHLISVAETAARLSITTKQVWRLIARGELQSVKLGRRRLIPSFEVDRLITNLLADQAS